MANARQAEGQKVRGGPLEITAARLYFERLYVDAVGAKRHLHVRAQLRRCGRESGVEFRHLAARSHGGQSASIMAGRFGWNSPRPSIPPHSQAIDSLSDKSDPPEAGDKHA